MGDLSLASGLAHRPHWLHSGDSISRMPILAYVQPSSPESLMVAWLLFSTPHPRYGLTWPPENDICHFWLALGGASPSWSSVANLRHSPTRSCGSPKVRRGAANHFVVIISDLLIDGETLDGTGYMSVSPVAAQHGACIFWGIDAQLLQFNRYNDKLAERVRPNIRPHKVRSSKPHPRASSLPQDPPGTIDEFVSFPRFYTGLTGVPP